MSSLALLTKQIPFSRAESAAVSHSVSTKVWIVTLVALTLVLLFDFALAFLNRNKKTSLKAATFWTLFYVGLAIAFGIAVASFAGSGGRSEFFAGWITEYSLSFDNLFVFILILARLKVEEEKAELVLLIGIVSSLFLRGIFIAGGSALVNRFSWIFYFFGLFLIYTAIQLFRENESEEWEEGRAIAFIRSKGASVFVLALSAISLTNVLFAFDSIPAIFGLTKNPYIIVTANVFALMGLRQLYFLIGGLMTKLVYLTEGLSLILAFIGVKLVLEAAIKGGHHQVFGIHIPEISLEVSLGFIVVVLATTALVSLAAAKRAVKE
jgi:tellurite resistance protein TerC